jgi:hypothetical protein
MIVMHIAHNLVPFMSRALGPSADAPIGPENGRANRRASADAAPTTPVLDPAIRGTLSSSG